MLREAFRRLDQITDNPKAVDAYEAWARRASADDAQRKLLGLGAGGLGSLALGGTAGRLLRQPVQEKQASLSSAVLRHAAAAASL